MVKRYKDNIIKLELERSKRELARLMEREQQQTARWSDLDTQLQSIIDGYSDPEVPRCLFVLLLCKLQQQGYTFQQLYDLISILPRIR